MQTQPPTLLVTPSLRKTGETYAAALMISLVVVRIVMWTWYAVIGSAAVWGVYKYGPIWVVDSVLPWAAAPVIPAFVLLGISLLLTIFPSTRGVAGIGIHIGGSIPLLSLWVGFLASLYGLWGPTGATIGLSLAGVGVIPLGLMAQFWSGHILNSILYTLIFCALFVARYSGMMLVAHEAVKAVEE